MTIVMHLTSSQFRESTTVCKSILELERQHFSINFAFHLWYWSIQFLYLSIGSIEISATICSCNFWSEMHMYWAFKIHVNCRLFQNIQTRLALNQKGSVDLLSHFTKVKFDSWT